MILIDLSQIEYGVELEELLNRLQNFQPIQYFNKDIEKISEENLSDELINKMNSSFSYDDTEIRVLLSNKVDMETLIEYRSTLDLITENDLTEDVRNKLNQIGIGYDDSVLITRITTLEDDKADITLLANYRSKDEKIDYDDLTENLKSLIENSSQLENHEVLMTINNIVTTNTNEIAQLKLDILDIKNSLLDTIYRQKVETINIENPNVIQLDFRPTIDLVKMFINGISYDENEEFTINRSALTLTWTATADNGGFDLCNELGEIVIEYKYIS